MELKDVQVLTKEMMEKYKLSGNAEINYIDLTSEIGELGKELLKATDYGTKALQITDNAELEIGDVLFSLTCLSNNLGIDMEESFNNVMQKYKKRFEEKGHIGSNNN